MDPIIIILFVSAVVLILFARSLAGLGRAHAGQRRRQDCPKKPYEFAQWARAHGYTPDQAIEAREDYTRQHQAEWRAMAQADLNRKPARDDPGIPTSDPATWRGTPITKTSPAKLPEWGRVTHIEEPIKVEPDSVFARRK